MGKKDWSTLRNEHKSRFAKRQLEEETSLVKSSASTNQSIENRDERLEEKLPKETEVIDSSIFPEPVKQVEELKDQSELGTEKAIDEQNEVLVEDSPDRPLTSQPPTQDAIEQFPKGEERVEHQGGTRLISEADLASLGGGRRQEPRKTGLDVLSDTARAYPSSSSSGASLLAAIFGLLAMVGLFVFMPSGGIHREEHPSSTSEYGSTGRSYGVRKETLKSGTSTLIAPEGEFQFQVTYEKAISLIPGLSEGDQGRTSSTYLSPQDVVAVLGKASSGEETYQEGSVGPFMTSLDYEAEGSPSSVSVLLSNMIGNRLSSLNFENLNSEQLANKNGSLNREDFANIKIGTSYSDLVNTVGIPNRVSWSSMMSSESFLIFYYKLSDSRSVIIRFGSNRTISEIKGLEDPATSTSTSP